MDIPDPLPYLDRGDAGQKLAEVLGGFRGRKDTVIIGILRGGVAVGRALADALSLPLLPWNVRKIGHPANPEFALGAIAEDGGTYLDEDMMAHEGLEFTDIEPIIEDAMQEMRRRREVFAPPEPVSLTGKIVLLTDDGAATGSTLLATLEDMRKLQALRIVVALPVAPLDTADHLRKEADEVVVLAAPAPFHAVGQWYLSFPQLTDEDVLLLLERKGKGGKRTAQKSSK
ncbi:MAG: phosphoribosyltransferase family protein [Candidatus Peribacteraceae bacterium]|jgi:predicted phosphoribosyltransferase